MAEAGSSLLDESAPSAPRDSSPGPEAAPNTRWCHLLQLSGVAAVNDAISPVAALLEMLVVARSLGAEHERVGLAAYSAVMTVVTFSLNVFNFVVVINMSTVAKAVGERAWGEARARARVAFAAAAIAGVACATGLIACETALFELYQLEPDVRAEARRGLFVLRAISIPFQLVGRTASGILSGYQQLHAVTLLNCALSAALVASNLLSMVALDGGLAGCAGATLVVFAAFAAVAVTVVARSAPHPSAAIFSRAHTDAAAEGPRFAARDFVSSASDMIVRSFLLSGSLWLMAVAASRLGSAQLGAHQIAVQLWTLASYIVDGFADVATMMGSKFLGMGHGVELRRVFNRLVAMALATGVLFAVVFAVGRDVLIGTFASNQATVDHLRRLWPVLVPMQVVNSLVFVYDGVVYATQRFDLVRNIMLIGCLGWFVPALLMVEWRFHSLVAIWAVKAVLNAWRAGAAIWLIHAIFYPRWRAGENTDGEYVALD